jgi:hypothetical protein
VEALFRRRHRARSDTLDLTGVEVVADGGQRLSRNRPRW